MVDDFLRASGGSGTTSPKWKLEEVWAHLYTAWYIGALSIVYIYIAIVQDGVDTSLHFTAGFSVIGRLTPEREASYGLSIHYSLPLSGKSYKQTRPACSRQDWRYAAQKLPDLPRLLSQSTLY